MSLLIAWCYFQKKYEPESNLSTNFLLIAPNIIVLDRLRADFDGPVLPEDGYEGQHWVSDFQMTLHVQDEIKPMSESGNLFLSNIHRVFKSDAEPSIDDEDATDFLLGKRPSGQSTDSGMDLGEIIRRVPDLVILNDEAHHIHDSKLAWFRNIEEIASAPTTSANSSPGSSTDPRGCRGQIRARGEKRRLRPPSKKRSYLSGQVRSDDAKIGEPRGAREEWVRLARRVGRSLGSFGASGPGQAGTRIERALGFVSRDGSPDRWVRSARAVRPVPAPRRDGPLASFGSKGFSPRTLFPQRLMANMGSFG